MKDSRTGEGSKYVWQPDLSLGSDPPKPHGGWASRPGQHSRLQNHLFEAIFSSANLEKAWKQVKSNGGTGGVDGITLSTFTQWYMPRREGILRRLFNGAYSPKPVKRSYLDKGNGKKRPLGIPVILDRIIQQAIHQVLSPVLEESFSNHSYGFRPNRGAHGAVRQLGTWIKEGYRWAVDIDLKSFFNEVPQARALNALRQRLGGDGPIVRLVNRYLKSGYIENDLYHPTHTGMPQGGPLSPLLSNLVLDELDRELEKRGHRFVRYADDFVVLTKSRKSAERVFGNLRGFIESRLQLKINEEKSSVCNVSQLNYLGFAFRNKRIVMSQQALEDFRYQLRQLSKRNWGVSMSCRLHKLREYIRGWMGYFALSEIYSLWPPIDSWLRCRIRMCYWRQWKRAKRRYLNLRKLGTRSKIAGGYAKSSKGYWRIAKTIGHNTGMTNQWLLNEGLIEIKQQWWNLKFLRITALKQTA